jgi:hypothetical protein
VEGWIFAENLRPFVEVLASLAGYALYDEQYDWVAIEDGLKDTDADEEKWYTYPLAGVRPLTLRITVAATARVMPPNRFERQLLT